MVKSPQRPNKKSVPLPVPLGRAEDPKAEKEAAALANNTLDEEAALAEHRRNESRSTATHWAMLCVLRLGLLIYAVFGVIWGWHLIAPPLYRWLTQSELSTLQTIIFSSAAAGTVGKYFDGENSKKQVKQSLK